MIVVSRSVVENLKSSRVARTCSSWVEWGFFLNCGSLKSMSTIWRVPHKLILLHPLVALFQSIHETEAKYVQWRSQSLELIWSLLSISMAMLVNSSNCGEISPPTTVRASWRTTEDALVAYRVHAIPHWITLFVVGILCQRILHNKIAAFVGLS